MVSQSPFVPSDLQWNNKNGLKLDKSRLKSIKTDLKRSKQLKLD